MRVLHITTNYPTPEYPIFGIFVKEQVESLRRLGIECDVFFSDGQGKGALKHLLNVPRVWWRILTRHYDVIHCHHAISGVILVLSGWAAFKKCVLSYQNDPDHEMGRKVYRVLNLFFNRFIVKNRSKYLDYPKFVYLPNGCDEEFFKPMDQKEARSLLNWDPERIYIMYMDSNKGVRTQKRKDRFEATLKILAERYGYDNIEPVIMRNVDRPLIPIYMNACNLHLMTSDFEGSPNSVKECMCCNTPVVSTNVGNVKEMIGDIDGSYVVDSFSAEDLAAAVDKVLCAKNVFSGREQFLSKGFGMRVVAEKLRSLYTEL